MRSDEGGDGTSWNNSTISLCMETRFQRQTDAEVTDTRQIECARSILREGVRETEQSCMKLKKMSGVRLQWRKIRDEVGTKNWNGLIGVGRERVWLSEAPKVRGIGREL